MRMGVFHPLMLHVDQRFHVYYVGDALSVTRRCIVSIFMSSVFSV